MPVLCSRARPCWIALVTFAALATAARAADEHPPVNKGLSVPRAALKSAPDGLDDLKVIETHVKKVIDKVNPVVVGIRAGGGEGSGVIVSADGRILTAGHVSGKPGREVSVILPNGNTVKGKALGNNADIDSGMVQITDEGTYPFVEMGKSADLKLGQWVITLGHPGGFKKSRPAPLRLGRVLEARKEYVRTDCTLVGGDSGGPLFDLEGKVVGVHSRIGKGIMENVHVPVDSYRDTWDRLVKGEAWGGFAGRRGVYLGVQSDPDADECRIAKVDAGSPAEKAGLKVGDVVTRFDDKRIEKFQDLVDLLGGHRPEDEVTLEVRRGNGLVKLKVKLERAQRPS